MNDAYNASPVALFVYNRPIHTRRTLEALVANPEAKDTDLIVFSDGPRNAEDNAAIREVRACIAEVRGFRSITICKREKNVGLADAIVDGVSLVVNARGRVIVLEDDIVVSRYFLRFMNDSLNLYENNEKVMHISAWLPPIPTTGLPETFFLRNASCWGWGTWQRAWKYFSRDSTVFLRSFSKADIQRFNLNDSYNFWSQIVANYEGRIKTWAVFWYASIFSRGGLCLHPRSNCALNIGFDGTGENCGRIALKEAPLASTSILTNRISLVENSLAMKRFEMHFRPTIAEPVSIFRKRHFFKVHKRIKKSILRDCQCGK